MAPAKKTIQAPADGDTVVGLFRDQPSAERAIQSLKAAGFPERQIGVAVRDRAQQEAITEGTGTQAAEGAATGAMSGGVVGGVIGLLAGVGALAIPGIGPIIAGGALASTLAGAGIGAAAGGLLGALVGMGIPEEDARHFERGFQEGGVLVTVQAGARGTEARQVLHDSEADLGSMGRDFTSEGADRNNVPSGQQGRTQRDDLDVGAVAGGTREGSQRLELREEQLDVEKERVQAGEVRVRKEVVTEQRTLDVPVTREEVVVERHPVSGDQRASAAIKEGEEIRIPLMEEEVRVEKAPVVREEIEVRKRQVEDTKQVSDTVRREEARIESQGNTNRAEAGDAGAESWRGSERRYHDDRNYGGPNRRMAQR